MFRSYTDKVPTYADRPKGRSAKDKTEYLRARRKIRAEDGNLVFLSDYDIA